MNVSTIDTVVILAYLAGVVGLGFWFARTSGDTRSFMAARGGIPGWAVGLSIFGTYLSSNTFLGVPGKAYATNWNAYAFSLSLPLAAWIAVRWFVPFHRNCGSISAYDHLEKRFGSWARTYGVVCYLLSQLARVGAVLFGVSLAVASLTGWSQGLIIVAAGVLITAYTVFGGIEAVIWTDVVQAVVLGLGAVLLLAVLLVGMPEGPGQAVRLAYEGGKLSLGSTALSLGKVDSWVQATLWVPLLYGLFENLKNFGIDQSYVQRYHTAPSEGQAKRSVWLGAMLYVPISAVFFAIGSASFAYYQTHPQEFAELKAEVAARTPGVEAASLTQAAVADNVLPHFIVNQLPPGVTGLLVAAIFAAAMSSVDTSLNSAATVSLLDIYKRHLRPDCGEAESMRVLYGVTALMGAAGVSVALAMIGIESVLDAWWALSGVFAGGLLGLFLLSLLAQHVERAGAACGVVVGVLVVLWLSLADLLGRFDSVTVPDWAVTSLHTHMTIVVGTLTVFLVGVLVSHLPFSKRSLA